jgi:hypothetical protein
MDDYRSHARGLTAARQPEVRLGIAAACLAMVIHNQQQAETDSA